MSPSTTTTTTSRRRRHVAICPFPFTSHPGTMLLLARKIAASAPNTHISLLTTDPSAATLSSSLSSEETANIRVVRVDDGLAGAAAEATTMLEKIGRFVEVAEESLKKGIAEAEEAVGAKIGCIVADALLAYAGRGVAEDRGVKWVALYSASSASLVAHWHTDKLRNAVASNGIEAHKGEALTVDKYIPGFPPGISLQDLPHEILGVDHAFPIARILELMSAHLPKAAAVLVNSFHPLELAETNILRRILGGDEYDKLLVAGPFNLTLSNPSSSHVADPNGCLAWLDTHAAASVIYISFGTGSMPPPEELGSLAEALAAAPRVPFLWSLPDRFKSFLPEGFITRVAGFGKVVPWAPQTAVLGHAATGAHVTHCGWNSLLESVVAGAPMICMPTKMADQALNARRAVAKDGWGIGVEVEGGRLTKAVLDRVMLGEEGRRMRDKIGAMKKLAQEAAGGPDGSSARNLHKFIDIVTS